MASARLSQDVKKKEKKAAALSCEVQRTFETSDGGAGGEESQAFLGRYGSPSHRSGVGNEGESVSV